MKKMYALLVALLATTTLSFAQWTSLPVYESFNYAEGNLGLAAATAEIPWNYGSNRSALVVAGPNLTYTGMTTTDKKVIKLVNTGSAANIKTIFPVQTGAVYASFLLRGLSAPSATSIRIAAFGGITNSSGTFSPGIFYDQSGESFKLGFDGAAGSASVQQSAEFALNTTVMVIMKYTPSATAAGGSADFWINPTGSSLSTKPAISFATGGVAGDVSFLTLKTGIGAADVLIDELHISTTWSGVAPQITSSNTNLGNNSLKLSTNLLNNQVSVVGGNDVTKVDFYSLDSRLVKSAFVSGNGFLSVDDLQKGLYVVKLTSGNMTNTLKALKQ